MPYRRYRFSTMMARASNSGSPLAIEVEASSFSVWNCVITFLQVLLISTILYGAGWNPRGSDGDFASETYTHFHHFRAIAFFFSVWALQSVALALLLVWAVGRRSYHLCHSWVLCEILMQVFLVLSGFYFTYHSFLHRKAGRSESDNDISSTSLFPSTLSPSAPVIAHNDASSPNSDSDEDHFVGMKSAHHYESSFRPPKHLAFLIILHFLIKGFGFWIIKRYMRLLATSSPVNGQGSDVEGAGGGNCSGDGSSQTRMSPPPSYDKLCVDDLPCYDEALKLCLKEPYEAITIKHETGAPTMDAVVNNNGCGKDDKNPLRKSEVVPVV